ncbi:MAG TPA: ABC transporter substrate-binding protein [Casimicrobiaceae bacterium]|nr:ABC transporter substrate-binding protein [Casimicrobiaceae bacterium]
MAARAEVNEVRMSRGLSLGFLPSMIMEDRKLIEKHAAAAGLGKVNVVWQKFSGGVAMNDALLAGQVDFAGGGPPPFAVLWARTRGSAVEVKGVAAMSAAPMYLLTRNPEVKSVRDFGPRDRISVPGAKISDQAVVLQMAAEQAFGDPHKLDPLTVALSLPDGFAALLANGEIDSQFSGPPFQYQTEVLKQNGIHAVLDSTDVLGGPATFLMLWTTTRFHDANPKAYAAVYDALREAIDLINSDREAVAEIFLRLTGEKMSRAEAMRILAQPDMRYTLAPEGVMRYVDFLHRIGVIKTRPDSWKDLFFPGPIQQLKGS